MATQRETDYDKQVVPAAKKILGTGLLLALWESRETIQARHANADLWAQRLLDTGVEQFDGAGKKILTPAGKPDLFSLRKYLAYYRAGLNNLYQQSKANGEKLDKIIAHLGIEDTK